MCNNMWGMWDSADSAVSAASNGCGNGCGCNGNGNGGTGPVTLRGVVTGVSCGQITVRQRGGCQEYAVLVNDACAYNVGDCVCVRYSGAMTRSVPPQISPSCIMVVDC